MFHLILFVPFVIIFIYVLLPKKIKKGKHTKKVLKSAMFLNFIRRVFIFPFFGAMFMYYLILDMTLPNTLLTKYFVLGNIIIFEIITILPYFKNIITKKNSKLIKILTPLFDVYIVLLAFFYSSTIKAINPMNAFLNIDLHLYPGGLIVFLGIFLLAKDFYIEVYKKTKLKIYLDIITWIIYVIIVYFVLGIVV